MGYKVKRIMMWVNQVRLPSEYQEVEYIGRNGNNYIDTGWIPNLSNQFEVKIGYKISSSGNRYGILSNYNALNKDVSFEVNTSNKARFYIQDSTSMDLTSSASVSTSSFSDIVFTSSTTTKKVSVDGTEDSLSNNKTGTSGTSAYLFIDRQKRWSTFTQNSFISYCKIYESGTLVRDFVPCYRKSDSVIGLYDLVNNQFYTNSGSGTFSKGNDVSDMVEKQVYPYRYNPGSNTLAYFPLAEDGLDKTGNYTLSNTGTQQTIGRKFTSTSSLNSVPSGCKTIVAWVKLNSYNSSSSGQSSLLRGTSRNFNILVQTDGSMSQLPTFYMYYNNTEYFGGDKIPTGQWVLIVETRDGTSLKGYINTTAQTVYSGTYPGDATASFLVNLGGNKTINVDMSNVIFESKSWTAQEITDYYNKTKSQYGIS